MIIFSHKNHGNLPCIKVFDSLGPMQSFRIIDTFMSEVPCNKNNFDLFEESIWTKQDQFCILVLRKEDEKEEDFFVLFRLLNLIVLLIL